MSRASSSLVRKKATGCFTKRGFGNPSAYAIWFSNKVRTASPVVDEHLTGVQLTVHRATQEIGGNCIELSTSDGPRIILDVGRPLDALRDASQLLPKSLDLNAGADGVLISHPHQDHYGLLEDVPAGWPIFSGAATERLIRLSLRHFWERVAVCIPPMEERCRIQIGPFTVTPFLIDHSAFDAYMLLIEVHGKRILYSGDFRIHGRKSTLTRRLMVRRPKILTCC